MSLTAGSRVGPYEILGAIGAGGMGEVYKARDTRLDRVVAIKQLKTHHSARFEHEARAVAALNHPHICTLYDIGPDYLVMEYIDGSPLRGPIAVKDATRLAGQIASALEAAHAKGILHCDLKPGNVLVSGGSAKLLDFGLAKLLAPADPDATKTGDGIVRGTLAYMSPEQVQGTLLDARSDVFSFGAVLYEILSGDRAFSGESSFDVLSKIVHDDPAPLRTSPALARIVTRCLRKAPADRFQRMAEVRAALEEPSAPLAAPDPSIAVLPFADMSPGKDNEYFSDGLSEEIINVLAQIKGLKVIARTSAFAFKGQHVDIRHIADTLGVAHVLDGSVRKAGNRIRATAQLISATDGRHLWSERYDRELADVFAVQDEIAAAVVSALRATLSMGPTPVRPYTPAVAAYEAFLKGRHYQWKITPESFARSRENFELAIARDPGFALAHSGLSQHYFMLAVFNLQPAHDTMPQARVHAQRALTLEPSLPEARAMLGLVAALYDYDWEESGRQFTMATACAPVSPWVRQVFGLFHLMYSGRPDAGVDEIRHALRDDPLSVVLHYALAVCLLAAGRDDEGAEQLRQVLELDEKFMTGHAVLAMREASRGYFQEALAGAERAHALAPWDPVTIGLLAGVLVRVGERGRADDLCGQLGDGSAFAAPIGWVVFHLLCDEPGSAGDWIEKAIDQRYPGILFFVNLPLGRNVRASARWPALARSMGLP